MDWDRLKQQLEQTLQTDVRLEQLGKSEWQRLGEERGLPDQAGRKRDGSFLFPLATDGQRLDVLVVEAPLSDSERQLLSLLLEAWRSSGRKTGRQGGGASLHADLRDWIEEQIAAGELEDREPPEKLAAYPMLYETRIPFLIYGGYAFDEEPDSRDEKELKKLLESFFDGDLLLLPLNGKEWLVLASGSLLDPDEDSEAEETTEERLASLCAGLHTVILNEGAGECHVTVYYPIVPAKSLPKAVARLREAISIGRLQRVDQFVHLPWELYLDQLLSPLSRQDRIRFIEQVFKRREPLLDDETIQTLETFFELNCNVSETAKHLYIHRNTLLYRLDKFRQESGLDVRNFNQAVHVKIALQLYKVTKRR